MRRRRHTRRLAAVLGTLVAVLLCPRDALAGPDAVPRRRAFMIGLEGLALQTPPLQPGLVRIDPRYVGSSVALGGAGVFGRWQAAERVGLDLSVRSGSIRYRDDQEGGPELGHFLLLSEIGALLYLARGERSQFALSSGIGGVFHHVRYELSDDRRGTQTFASLSTRLGIEAEFLLKRIAFVLSLRGHGVYTDRDFGRTHGAAFDGASASERRAPTPTLQTWIVAAAGIAYRF